MVAGPVATTTRTERGFPRIPKQEVLYSAGGLTSDQPELLWRGEYKLRRAFGDELAYPGTWKPSCRSAFFASSTATNPTMSAASTTDVMLAGNWKTARMAAA